MTVLVARPVDPADAADPAGRAARAEHARSLLRRAEERAGLRASRARTASATAAPLTVQHGTPTPTPLDVPREPDERSWPVHGALAPLLPSGAIRRGTVLAVQGSTSLLLALLARASATGAWTTMVGFPGVGLLAAADAGIDLGRLALVPRPGPDAAAAVAALVDGMDVVVVGPQTALGDADRRRLAGRARERGATLVAATPWSGAHVALTVTGGSWTGVDHGAGWLRRRTLTVERAGRSGAARPVRVEVELPLDRSDWPAYLREQEAPGAGAPGADAVGRTELPSAAAPQLRLVG
ncbi:hypothetical protein [Cellulosimicrobium arenosum]|uniref:Uncharacterized protein n=1 Tax=Cellulosimicrobium arenosum TaxID=2708133 RepID=A0A927G6T8_9MICO|nr:hypothetical protein [Cellulosimicrobium arenosum]MBD8077625.1 hypothetical protein [Cellulosimicrobium arenosum]